MLRLLADLLRTEPVRFPSSYIKQNDSKAVGRRMGGATLRFNGNNKVLSQAIKPASDTYRSAGVRNAI